MPARGPADGGPADDHQERHLPPRPGLSSAEQTAHKKMPPHPGRARGLACYTAAGGR